MSKTAPTGHENTVEHPEDAILEKIPPEQFVETANPRLIHAGLACMHSRETVMQYLSYENQHQNRTWMQRLLAERARELAEEEST